MSQEHETVQQTDELSDEGKQALSALRGIWDAQSQTSADIDESCGNTKSCKNMVNVGFHGLAEDSETSKADGPPGPVGNNLRAAWKTKLEREGKLKAETGSVRDLVFGTGEPTK